MVVWYLSFKKRQYPTMLSKEKEVGSPSSGWHVLELKAETDYGTDLQPILCRVLTCVRSDGNRDGI